ncbi:MAG: hypothetical protein ACI9SK_000161 [Zhongshania sp.]|jgi:hypothetical protein
MDSGSKRTELDMTSPEYYLAELETRLNGFFSDQADGLDIPPALLYRLEGFIDAGIMLAFISATDMKKRLTALAEHYAGADAAAIYENDDRIILHLLMPEAPVYPSTKS